ncbi:GW dipeptide domain-containing protein [Myxococcota bacterium]|nr:GW dipeptide domain-containing protein [Myxococcota bacterium]
MHALRPSLGPRSAFVAAAVAASLFAPPARAVTCRSDADRPQVFVKAKSAVRRGPGLNYAPSAVLDDGRCVAVIEVSLDESWVLVEDDDKKLFGWVPASALDPESRPSAGRVKPKTAPIGSGQERGFVTTSGAASLRARPDADAEEKKALPEGSRLLALATTEDARWVEVRDDRGETGWVDAQSLIDPARTLAGLPRTTAGLKTGLDTNGADPSTVVRGGQLGVAPARTSDDGAAHTPSRDPVPAEDDLARSGPSIGGLQVEARVLGTAALPQHALDSNGANANRRYTVRANAAGGRVELRASGGGLEYRLGYAFLFLAGLEPTGDATQSVGGQTHEGSLVVGYPITAGPVRLVPEVGYDFSLFAMEPSLPRDPTPLFVSSHAHGLSVGGTGIFTVTDGLDLEVAAAGIVGTTLDYPFDIGGSGLSFGARAGTTARLALMRGFGLVASYGFLWRRAPFSGPAGADATITEATLTHVEHGVSLGVALGL